VSGTVDTSELDQLVRDLRVNSETLVAAVRPLMERGGLNMKRQMVAEMAASTHFGPTAPSISYDVKGSAMAGGIEVEVGPDKSRRGALANVAYFGTSRGGGTVPDPVGALNAEAPRFVSALEALIRTML